MLSQIRRRGLGFYYSQQQHGVSLLAAGSCCCPALNLSRGLQGGANPHEPEVDLLAKNLWVNTLTLTKSFEKAGISRSEAEALAEHLAKLIVVTKNKLEDSFVKHQHLEKIILEQEAKIVGFKTELQKSQDIQQTTVAKDLDRQQSFLDKMRTEVKHEIDKLTASQRLDLNLEKGRMRDDLQMMRDKATELEIKVDRDINELRSAVEKAKNDTIKSVITILGTFSAIAFTISRFVQMSNGG